MPDRQAAELAAIRAEMTVSGPRFADAGRLLAALDAVLELADDWDAASIRMTGELADAGMPAALRAKGTPAAGNPLAGQLRAAISRALLGEEAGDVQAD